MWAQPQPAAHNYDNSPRVLSLVRPTCTAQPSSFIYIFLFSDSRPSLGPFVPRFLPLSTLYILARSDEFMLIDLPVKNPNSTHGVFIGFLTARVHSICSIISRKSANNHVLRLSRLPNIEYLVKKCVIWSVSSNVNFYRVRRVRSALCS